VEDTLHLFRLPARFFLVPLSLALLAQTPPESPVIQSTTRAVVLDVVVKDRHGKPVEDLRREDFMVRDNGHEQRIALFAMETGQPASTGASTAASAPLTFTNKPPATRTTAFLFDELNTQLADQQLAKKDFLHYLHGVPPDERVAVFVLGDSLTLLHDFSQDMPSLLAAMNRHVVRGSPEAAAEAAPAPTSNSLAGDSATTDQWDAFLASSTEPYTNYSETVRATRTAAALETIAAHLQGLPGRKTLIWISSGFPIQLGLDATVDSMPQSNPNARNGASAKGRGRGAVARGAAGGGATGANNNATALSNTASSTLPGMDVSFDNDVVRAVRALNEADVAVYPVNAKGLTVAAPFEADRASIGRRNRLPKPDSTDFDQETLLRLADETGGRAFYNINDLGNAFREAADDARVSYSVVYYAPANDLDGTWHKIEVAVQRPGVTLRYRPGYVAARQPAVTLSLADAVNNPVTLTGIGFTAHLDPTDGGYKLSVNVDARNLTLEQKDGKWTGQMQFLVVVGKTEQLTTVPLSFSDAMFHQIQDHGLTLGARVKAPPGTKGFSLGFRDVPSGSIGTLHVSLRGA